MNHINDLVEFLADRNGKLECGRFDSGELCVSITVEGIESVGCDIHKVIDSATKAYGDYIRNKSVVPLHKNQGGK